MKKALVFAVGVVLAFAFASQSVRAAQGWTAYATIEEVYPQVAGGFYARMNVSTNPTSCTRTDWFYSDGSALGASRVFATLLAAHASGKPVRIYVTTNCDSFGAAEIGSVSLIQ